MLYVPVNNYSGMLGRFLGPMRPRGYKTFFVLNSTEHEISTAYKTKIPTNEEVPVLSLSDVLFIMLINVKMPTIVGILTFMSRIHFVLS